MKLKTLGFTLLALASTEVMAFSTGLYGLRSGFAPVEFDQVNTATGEASTIGTVRIFGGGITYDHSRNIMYAADAQADAIWMFDDSLIASQLVSGANYTEVTYNPLNDRIYAADNNNIYEIDPNTQAVTNLGDPGIGVIYALGYNTNSDNLYAIGSGGISGGGDFYRFDDLSDLSNRSLITQLQDQGIFLVNSMAFDATQDLFYASVSNDPFRSLITVDDDTGAASLVGPHNIGNDSMRGLAIVPGVPVPAAVWLFASGLLGLAGVARRR